MAQGDGHGHDGALLLTVEQRWLALEPGGREFDVAKCEALAIADPLRLTSAGLTRL